MKIENKDEDYFSYENQKKRIDNMFYKHTKTLVNKLNIKKDYVLEEKENRIVRMRTIQLLENKDNTLDSAKLDTEEDKINFLKNINRFLYGDIYEFAGEIRTEDFQNWVLNYNYNVVVDFEDMQNFGKCFEHVFSGFKKENYDKCSLQEKIILFSDNMSKLWDIHPFYKGNSITTVIFSQQFAERELNLNMNINNLMKYDLEKLFVEANTNNLIPLVEAMYDSIDEPDKYSKLFREESMLVQDETYEEEREA